MFGILADYQRIAAQQSQARYYEQLALLHLLAVQREHLARTRFKVGPWRFYGNGRSAKE